ncbi:pyrroline-5-carboxylate reductase [Actinomyces sp. oral taxon 414]|uniref:pyrroline-5-carboxylate reductase n=1 Tax=Actinomyces sp. oral taxon 414 TaxID=712122 RepID=UPI0006AFCC30|nr:pyrroline-5-carboxylate reductase [Actinomyces sp. oral taxon 414]ALC99512.1 pyrroline-5-carboxylate reductase [Actinomyces sp. oral taxon 414]
MTTYGFIGAGNMAGAIVRGAIAAGTDPASIWLTSAHDSAARLAEKTGARHEPDAEALAAACDVVVLAVKPRVIPAVAARIFDAVAAARPLIVSIAAGIDLARLESLLPEGARVVRAMPNMAAGVGQSMTALAAGAAAGESDLAAARALMDAVGRTMVIAEEDFPTFVGLAGSSPAFVFTFIDALARAGVLGGIPKAQAVEIAAQAVLGSARAVQVEAAARADGGAGRTPADLVDAVCSPGGTTVAGLVAMERAGFSNAVIEAVRAVVAADRDLAG